MGLLGCLRIPTVLLLGLMLLRFADGLAVMSVDLGSEWMKVGVVSPGLPMEICLNRDSQRKTPVVVAFREGERMFGDMALSTQTKFPEKAFSNFLDLLGKPLEHPIVQDYIKRFPFYKISADDKTGGVIFDHPEGYRFTVEELVAMILKQAQQTAAATAGQPVKDAVISVPAFFNQAERRALATAAKIAGINLLQLMNDNTAVALNFGVFRRKEFNNTPTNVLFYDMGTGSTKATVVSYQTAKTKDRGYTETAPVMTITGVGFDRNLGGLEFKMRLGDYLADKFDAMKKTSKKVRENTRALFKLYKEAERVKKILSANSEINAQVENVMEDVDMKIPVSREEFEGLCTDLFDRVTKPIDDALASSEIGLENIHQVIVVGGNSRIPKIQQILEEYMNGKPLGKNVNADEAAAMGASYQAAYLSKGFKVKTFVAKDANAYPIQVEFSRDGTKNIQRVIFNRNAEFPKKKTILASRMENDFTIYVNYGDLSFLSKRDRAYIGNFNISSAVIKGVSESLQKHPGDEIETKGVRIHLTMDASGIFRLETAETLFEKDAEEEIGDLESTFQKIGSTIGKLFGGGGEAETENDTAKETAEKEPSKADETAGEEKSKEDKSEKGDEKTAEKKEKESEQKTEEKPSETKETKKAGKRVEIKEPLERDLNTLDMPAPTQDDLEPLVTKLRGLDEKDQAKLTLDKARNSLESFILETKDKLTADEYKKASSDEERAKIMEALSKEQEWLEYESDGADTDTLKGKLSTLAVITKDVSDRVNEHRERPQALAALGNLLKLSKDYLVGLQKIPEDDSIFTKVELETLEKLIKETKEWKSEQETIQAKTPPYETPKLTMKGIFEKIQGLDRETKYLMNKARYAPPKKVKKEEKPEEKIDEVKEEKEAEEVVVEDSEEKPLEKTEVPKNEETAGDTVPVIDTKTTEKTAEPGASHTEL